MRGLENATNKLFLPVLTRMGEFTNFGCYILGEAVKSLANKVVEQLRTTLVNPLELAGNCIFILIVTLGGIILMIQIKGLQMTPNESGFEILSPALITVSAVDVAVQVLVTTQYHNLRKLDPNLHRKFYSSESFWQQILIEFLQVDAKICLLSLNSVKHARWFEENASHST